MYLIWSEEHGAWWKHGGCGYTDRIALAGRYPKEQADRIVDGANWGRVFHEIAVPVPDGLDAILGRSRGDRSPP